MKTEYQGTSRVKKPSAPKRKSAQATSKSRAPAQAKLARKSLARPHQTTTLRVIQRSSPCSKSALSTRVPLVAGSYSQEERQILLLLMTPFVLMTIAVGISQALMHGRAPEWQVARSISSATFARIVPPSELAPHSSASLEALKLSGSLSIASLVSPHAVLEATLPATPLRVSLPRTAREALPTFARLEASPPPAALNASPSSEPIGVSLPAEVAVRTASLALLSRCEATSKNAGSGLLTSFTAANPEDFGRRLARAAQAQTQNLVIYTDKYRTIRFPMGDVPPLYGVCTDVVIRAYRTLGIDLQVLVHKARVGTGDTSIDHRRTKTLRRFFARHGNSIPVTEFPEDYHPGDIVTYHQPLGRGSQLHIAIVSDVIAASGRPMIVHNRGWGPQLEDALFYNQVTGHYRYSGPARQQKASASKSLPLSSRPMRKPATVLSAR